MLIRAFITHKKAEQFSDCQDRFSIAVDTKSIALSDGMSQSIYQKQWARILVDRYTSEINWVPNKESVKELTSQWREEVQDFIKSQKEAGNQGIWRAERMLSDGKSAGATFLGIRFNGKDWSGYVLGDSCLIKINNNKIEEICSSQEGESFDNYPDYFDSNLQNEGKGIPKQIKGTLGPNTPIFMVSDPFSDYLQKAKGTPEESTLIKKLLDIQNHQEFEEVIEDWRRNGMHNDDSTLIVVIDDGSEYFNLDRVDSIDELIEKGDPTEESNQQTTSLIKKPQESITKEVINQQEKVYKISEIAKKITSVIITYLSNSRIAKNITLNHKDKLEERIKKVLCDFF